MGVNREIEIIKAKNINMSHYTIILIIRVLKIIYNKYLLLGVIFILTSFNGIGSLSINTNFNSVDVIDHNENLTICIEEIKDGLGLTVKIYNNADFNVENGKLIFILKKTYEIPFLAAGDTTEVHIVIFGFRPRLLLDYPQVTIKVSAPVIETFWKTFSIGIMGLRTKIVEELSFSGEPYEGYTLFGPEYSTYTYLINMDGKIVYTWKSDYIQGLSTDLLENGDLLRLDEFGGDIPFAGGGRAGRVEKFDKDSNLIWEFEYANNEHCSHHDIEPLSNGNILLIAWEYKTREESIAAGRNPNNLWGNALWPDHIIEVEPTGASGGNIVWEWHVWDHLIQDYDPTKDNYGMVKDHPELVDINFGDGNWDWNHINEVDYNENFDQILLSVHYFNEIWIIDHSTTTKEAAGHTGGNSGKGGDLLYRWGNPQAYGTGDATDQQLFGQHGANWIEKGCPGKGNILVFNNGRPAQRYSSIYEIVPPVNFMGKYEYEAGEAYGPDLPIWIYKAENPGSMYSFTLSSAQRLPNGNTLICSADQGLFLEVTQDKNVVWQYRNFLPTSTNNAVARIIRYPPSYPGIPRVKSINQK